MSGEDTWTETPYVEGIVLIGDAGGYNDPIIGEGRSLAHATCGCCPKSYSRSWNGLRRT
jgi:flavin-dependent dehydrogenase